MRIVVAVRRRTLVSALVLVLLWVVAATVNSGDFIMGGSPSFLGSLSTLVALAAWPVAGLYSGGRLEARFVRFATVFWVAAALVMPLMLWGLIISDVQNSELAGLALLPLVLVFAFGAPVYGVVAMLPRMEPALQVAVVGILTYSLTLLACLVSRRSQSRRNQM